MNNDYYITTKKVSLFTLDDDRRIPLGAFDGIIYTGFPYSVIPKSLSQRLTPINRRGRIEIANLVLDRLTEYQFCINYDEYTNICTGYVAEEIINELRRKTNMHFPNPLFQLVSSTTVIIGAKYFYKQEKSERPILYVDYKKGEHAVRLLNHKKIILSLVKPFEK